MAEKKDRYWRMLAVTLVVITTLACGCAGQSAVDHGAQLVSWQRAHRLRQRAWNYPQLSVMNSDGSEQRILDVRGAAKPAWSLTEKIAYVIDIGRGKESWDNEKICVINAEGAGRTRLTEIPGNDHWPPTWSPDSTRIAFTSDGTLPCVLVALSARIRVHLFPPGGS